MTRQQVDLVQAISKKEPLLRHLMKVGQTLTMDLPDEPILVTVDSQSLDQMLHNLVTNASEAMEEGGQVCIRLEPYVNSVALHVEDNGQGIADDEIVQIFEPFFSSKASGRGMGLSIVQAAAYRNGFQIRVNSEVAVGTRVTIDIPRHNA